MFIIVTLTAIGLIVGSMFILAIGWGQAKSMELITEAIAQIRKYNFKMARQLVLNATRLNGKLLKDEQIKALYDSILAEKIDDSRINLASLAEAVRNRPRSRAEIIAAHPMTKVVVVVLVVGFYLIKLAEVFGH